MLDRIHKIAEIIAAFAIVGSLVFVGLQLNQNTAALHTTIGQSYLDTWLESHRTIIGDNDLAIAVWKQSNDPADYSELEWIKKYSFVHLSLRQSEYMYLQYLRSNLDEELWQSWFRGMVATMRDPFYKATLQRADRPYAPAFLELTEQIFTKIEAQDRSDPSPP